MDIGIEGAWANVMIGSPSAVGRIQCHAIDQPVQPDELTGIVSGLIANHRKGWPSGTHLMAIVVIPGERRTLCYDLDGTHGVGVGWGGSLNERPVHPLEDRLASVVRWR